MVERWVGCLAPGVIRRRPQRVGMVERWVGCLALPAVRPRRLMVGMVERWVGDFFLTRQLTGEPDNDE